MVETIWWQTTSWSSGRARSWLLLEKFVGSFEIRARKDCTRLSDLTALSLPVRAVSDYGMCVQINCPMRLDRCGFTALMRHDRKCIFEEWSFASHLYTVAGRMVEGAGSPGESYHQRRLVVGSF
jgi:hypothetical protein